METPWGSVAGKLGWIAGQEPSFSPEFEACRTIAEAQGVPLKDVYEVAHRSFDAAKTPPST
ncbi:MAG: DUF111 family protein [Pirellulales bacterium]